MPGIARPQGRVGPPLTHFSQRSYIAGVVPNTPATLTRFIREPEAVAPGTAMPSLGFTEAQAQAVAAYLYVQD